ncbi:MAG: hypothetical protein Q8Q35_00360 [Nanoarchaeota archaeon]|nr:hypothetical protein [Nanoarchaeota archaeon]
MAKKKKIVRSKTRAKVAPAKDVSMKRQSSGFWWGLLGFLLGLLGLAFLVQGFILQLASGVLYYGLLHYAVGMVLLMLAMHAKWKSYSGCKDNCCH